MNANAVWSKLPIQLQRLQLRYVVLAIGALISLHTLFSLSSASYASSTSLDAVRNRWTNGPSTTWQGGKKVDSHSIFADGNEADGLPRLALEPQRKANATFVILARNSDVWEILSSIRQMEDRFNHKYHYPYVFLNDEPFSDEFKTHTSSVASAPCHYGLVPPSHWSEQPEWIDQDRAREAREEMERKGVIYGGSVSYRLMCRYQSGFFWRHPLLDGYKYYWRIEPNVKYFCDLDYDPFLVMQDGNKKYGFTVTIYEYAETIPTLWDATKEFIKENPQYLPKPNLMKFVSEDGGETYNRCHFWSNFEIGDLDFWRGEAYRKYFDHLDRAGGFFYERWGDAPVHSIAASLFLKPEEVHFFQDIGYRHEPFQHCPKNSADRCWCNPRDGNNFEDHWYSCTPRYKKITHFG